MSTRQRRQTIERTAPATTTSLFMAAWVVGALQVVTTIAGCGGRGQDRGGGSAAERSVSAPGGAPAAGSGPAAPAAPPSLASLLQSTARPPGKVATTDPAVVTPERPENVRVQEVRP
jgi:hypothetical protein